MPTRVRKLLAASCALVLLLGVATPAYSSSESMRSMMAGTDPVSPVVDVLLLRPVAFVSLVAGTALFLVALPIIAITRPQEIGRPLESLVVNPARYIWLDPIGTH